MVGSSHEAMHRIFQEDLTLITRALRKLLDIPFPEPETISPVSPDLTEIKPLERRVDTLLRLDMNDGSGYLLAIEAQGKKDPNKPSSWASYLAHLYAKYRLPPVLVVVCQDKATATWAAEPIRIGIPGQPSLTVRPLVRGPHNVPAIFNVEAAARDIPLAAFSALTHGKDPDTAAILETLAAALKTVDDDTATLFSEFTGIGLGNTPAGQIWRDLMTSYASFFRSPFAEEVREEAREEGRAEGRAEARAEGRAEAEAKARAARAEERAQLVLKILDRRGIEVPAYMRQAISGCQDLDVLGGWLDRALTVTTAGELFADA
ncbi:hypothetical protein [Streptomyces gobiensis]|uniref:hypothetical protein n=1 Tax=Streptomyces gobiensis TaxID=2875706 RepID=UPI001E41F39E|nr:hypothetical protein [Streptomyces gobiensis]UGY90784.1 hypothetical protein test1122_02960 [Streptomyces gobiensis]